MATSADSSNFALSKMQKSCTMRTKLRVVFGLMAVAVLALSTTTLSAQHTYKFRDSLGTYKVVFTPANPNTVFKASPTKPLAPRTHELRFGLAWGATDYYGTPAFTNYIANRSEELHYSGESHWVTFAADYGYWTNEWFSIGGSLSWTTGFARHYSSLTHDYLGSTRYQLIAIMPEVRFAWLRHGMVQLYSSVALGLGIEMRPGWRTRYLTEFYPAFDFKPIGISIGRKWFGFVELGYGSRGIINVGFGHRINPKQR